MSNALSGTVRAGGACPVRVKWGAESCQGLSTSVLMPVNLSERCLKQVAFIFGQCGLRLFLVTAVTAVTGSYCWLLQLLGYCQDTAYWLPEAITASRSQYGFQKPLRLPEAITASGG